MALYVKYHGHANTLATLEAAGFTQDNRVGNYAKAANTTLDDSTPKGVLGGSVAAITGPYTVGACDETLRPVGIFLNDAAGNPYENTPAVASGKAPYMHSMGAAEVDVYESVTNAATPAPITYTEGELLYCSENGLLCNDTYVTKGSVAIAVCTKAPDTDGRLGFNLLI